MNTIDRPTVLLVGAGERMKDALADALERHRMMVESVPTARAVDAAFAAAPDLVVLIGDAAADGGRDVLARLGRSAATATVPVVLLADDAALDRRLDAFRHGVVAVVPRTASADGMARRVAEVARELPERQGEASGELGEATVDELVELFSQQLRTGILSVTTGDSDQASAQVVLRAGRPVAEAIEELVDRLRPLVRESSGPLRYEFHESTSARLTLLDDESEPEDTSYLSGRRIVLIEQNPARADVLVQELRAQGALVVVADGEGAGLDRARTLDPEVVIIDGSGVNGWALPGLRALRRDVRLRWASLLVVDTRELWPVEARGPDLARLAASLKPLVRPAQELAERAQREDAFGTRLDVIGPSRMLRALTGTGLGLRVSVSHPRARIEVDLAEGLVAGARAIAPGKGIIGEGPAALAALLALSAGRVHVERKEAPASADVMAPLDDALAAAARERPPIAPSIPPPGVSEPPAKASSAPADAEKLVGRLEELLERLARVLPAAEAAAQAQEEPPTQKREALPKEAAVVPPPRAALPPAPAPDEDDDDLPVIEGTAARAPSAMATAAIAPAPRAPSMPAVATAPVRTVRAPSTPSMSFEPVSVGRRAPSTPFIPIDVVEGSEPATPSVPAPPADPPIAVQPRMAAPSPTPLRDDDDLELPIRKSRGPLWFGIAFVATLLVGGGVAAYFQLGSRLPFLSSISGAAHDGTIPPPSSATPAATVQDTAPAPSARDAGPPDAGVIEARDAGPIDAGAATDGGATDGGATDSGTGDSGASSADAGPAPIDAGESEVAELEDAELEAELEGTEDPPSGSRSDRVAHLVRVANYERNRGHLQAADQAYHSVLQLDGDNPRALAGLARLDLARRNPSAAVRWARRLVQSNPRNAANHVLLGDTLEAVGNHRAAVRSWQHALELSPGTRSARRRLEGSR